MFKNTFQTTTEHRRPMDNTEKTRENRVRRVALRRGLRLEKSRRRDAGATGFGGYRLVDTIRDEIVLGADRHEFGATLDDVEAALAAGIAANYDEPRPEG